MLQGQQQADAAAEAGAQHSDGPVGEGGQEVMNVLGVGVHACGLGWVGQGAAGQAAPVLS
jgi:hypothetical protein